MEAPLTKELFALSEILRKFKAEQQKITGSEKVQITKDSPHYKDYMQFEEKRKRLQELKQKKEQDLRKLREEIVSVESGPEP